ncbi:MAG: sulfurtransferase TusA family protein [Anaerolinea sp.]|nr:sulfurtransferase TusA family protein [Anaerolinea sp.]MCC6976608.1 sulfurtransferase TusA family protein [Anaerolineae bacterium]CAG1001462.1 hypothetical protein ANRL4_03181 [Anaerolineae bacterium]
MAEPGDHFASDLEICFEVLLYLSSRMAKLPSGETFEFVSGDPDAVVKVTDWCEARDYPLLRTEILPDGRARFVIQKS